MLERAARIVEVPINTAFKGDLLTYMLTQAECKAIITKPEFVERIRAHPGRTLQVTYRRGDEERTAEMTPLERDGAGLPLASIELHRPSLDDVFLTKTGRSLREN